MLHQILGSFLDRDTETQYLKHALKSIKKAILFSTMVFLVNAIAIIFSDIRFINYDFELSNPVILGRLLFIIFIIGYLITVYRLKSPQLLQTSALFFYFACAVINFLAHYYNPRPELITYTIEFFIILAFYLLYPINLKYQIIGSVLFTLTMGASLMKMAVTESFFYQIIVLLISINVIGAYFSRYLNMSNRKMYVKLISNKRTKRDLKSYLSDIKLIEGIIPICASCKKIRNDDGFWNNFDFHFNNVSNAEFIDQTCPNCEEKGDHEH